MAWPAILMQIIGGLMGGQGEGNLPIGGGGSLQPGAPIGGGGYQPGQDRGPLMKLGAESTMPAPPARQPNVMGALGNLMAKRSVPDPRWLQNMYEKPGGAGGGVIFMPRELTKKQQILEGVTNLFTSGMLNRKK